MQEVARLLQHNVYQLASRRSNVKRTWVKLMMKQQKMETGTKAVERVSMT